MVYDKEMKVKEKKKIVGKYRMMRKEKEEKEMGLYQEEEYEVKRIKMQRKKIRMMEIGS